MTRYCDDDGPASFWRCDKCGHLTFWHGALHGFCLFCTCPILPDDGWRHDVAMLGGDPTL
jgi:hypothetical protein